MLRTHTLGVAWPDLTWQDIPNGAAWITLATSPVPFVWIREERSDDAGVRLWIGKSLRLDPAKRYQIKNVADPAIDLITAPGAGVATLTWIDRKTEIVLSDVPVENPGRVKLSFSLTKVQAAAIVISDTVRFTTAKRAAIAFCYSAGTITAMGLSRWTPNIGLINNAAFVAPTGSAVPAYLGREAEAESGTMRWAGQGAVSYVSFAITTTPTAVWDIECEVP